MTEENKNLAFEELLKRLKDAPADIKQSFYEDGRKESVDSKSTYSQIRYHLGRNNIVLALIMIGGIFIAGIWVWSNIFQPLMMKFGLMEKQIYSGYVKIPNSFEIFKGNKPTRDTITKVEVKPRPKEDGGSEPVTFFMDKSGNLYSDQKDYKYIKSVSMQSRFDWRLQPGFGFVVDAFADDSDKIIDTALFVSPLEIYSKISLDAFVTPNKAGAGLSGKLPFRWTNNTYIGGGVGVRYRDLTEKVFFIYGKVDF